MTRLNVKLSQETVLLIDELKGDKSRDEMIIKVLKDFRKLGKAELEIERLKSEIERLKVAAGTPSTPQQPQIIYQDRIVEKPIYIEKPIYKGEKIVEKIVEVPVEKIVEKQVFVWEDDWLPEYWPFDNMQEYKQWMEA
jgi:hypothetical protein